MNPEPPSITIQSIISSQYSMILDSLSAPTIRGVRKWPSSMSTFDQRQYRIMLQKLEAIEAGAFYSALVTDLKILLDYVETSDPDWDSDFQDGLNDLELEMACAIVETEDGGFIDPSFDEEAAKRMRATAARLKQLVLAKIEPPADDSQDFD